MWFCSDEHVTFSPRRRCAWVTASACSPAHVDPTVAYHAQLHVVDGDEVLEQLGGRPPGLVTSVRHPSSDEP